MSVPRLQSGARFGPTPAPAGHKGLKKGVYLVPSLFTAMNILAGFYSLMATMSGFSLLGIGGPAQIKAAEQRFDYAAMAIGWAFVCDCLDGRIARMTRSTTEIGIQLDSLADIVSFGLAPAILAYAWGYGTALQDWSNARQLAWFISFMFVICGGFRLARFNVQASRPRPLAEGTPKVDKKSFVGLPIPVAGCLIAAIVHFAPTPIKYAPHRSEVLAILTMVLMGFLSLLMVSTLRFTSFKSIGVGRRNARLVIAMIALVGLIYLYSQWVLLLLVIAYVVHGLLSRGLTSLGRRSPEKQPAEMREI
ncbi:MAG: CDP-diacylglycerol---serine O-phosphatidyltransferase [Blastocatellia bacterium]|jgi:CDP-diacylglycerol--serine O-phosphatidyltransferase|nr:CDP-diacylglycerol---serine O-phosphatidyltransferase [Blastocatellia bacterium]